MTVDGVTEMKLLFGPGGFVRINRAGRFGAEASTIDITWVAEDLCRAGIRLPRAVPEPAVVNGDVEADLGEGGRAIWCSGGGDIDVTEVLWAIAAAFDQLPAAEIVAIMQARRRSANRLVLAVVESALEHAGLTRRQISALLRRPRTMLGGQSAEQLFDKVLVTADEVSLVVDLAVERVRALGGSAAVVSFLQMLSNDPAVSGRAR